LTAKGDILAIDNVHDKSGPGHNAVL